MPRIRNLSAYANTRAVTVTDQHALIMLDLKHMVGSIPRRCRPVLMGHALEKPFFNPNMYVHRPLDLIRSSKCSSKWSSRDPNRIPHFLYPYHRCRNRQVLTTTRFKAVLIGSLSLMKLSTLSEFSVPVGGAPQCRRPERPS